MGGRGYSSATARRSSRVKAMGGVNAYGIKGNAPADVSEALNRYANGKAEDAKMIGAQQKGDTKSEYGKLAQAIDDYAQGKGTNRGVFRGVAMTDKEVKAMVSGKKGFPNRATLNSWSIASAVAMEFAVGNSRRNIYKENEYIRTTGKKHKTIASTPVLFRMQGGVKNAASVSAAGLPRMRKVGDSLRQEYSEQEYIGSKNNQYEITGYERGSYNKYGAHVFDVRQVK